jgi:Dyp-type peroxidase family
MLEKRFAREAPAPPPLVDSAMAAPAAPNEPRLEIEEIQGNIVPGFNKDFQALLFLKITDAERCRLWLRSLIPFVATTEQVLAFNRLFKSLRTARGDTMSLQAVWVNVALSFAGLKKLATDADQFRDASFKAGMAQQAGGLGDPVDDPQAAGNPANWFFGNAQRPADIVLIVAGDNLNTLLLAVNKLENSLFGDGMAAGAGLEIVFRQSGAVLPPPLTGHEHFGFLDGVSQPGVRGRVSADPSDVLTPRQNPDDPDQGKPGQDLLWPGEFIFGYTGQDPQKPVPEPGPVIEGGPSWSHNGSLLVIRRLRQDVGEFHRFLHAKAAAMGLPPAQLGAMLVGRWASGAPILRAQNADNTTLGDNDCANNNFEFHQPTPKTADGESDTGCAKGAAFPTSPGDQTGAILPFAGHIRKAYPRDDITPGGAAGKNDDEKSDLSEQDTQTHRLLRRGIPFGPPSRSTPEVPVGDKEDRGLLFLAYQTSIEGQFEFVTQNWVNNPDFRAAKAGFDLVIGQNSAAGENRVRRAQINGRDVDTKGFGEWVIPTGGEYFFAPSLAALRRLSGAAPFTTAVLNVVVQPGSKAEDICLAYAGKSGEPLTGKAFDRPRVTAAAIVNDHANDLKFQGGKTIADLVFKNFYVGGDRSWAPSDRKNIDEKLAAAMSDVNLNNVILQYFPNRAQITSTFRGSEILAGQRPQRFTKGDVENLVTRLAQDGKLAGFDLGSTVFNFMLPRGTELTDDDDSDDSGQGATQRRPKKTAPQATRKPLVDADDAASSFEGLGGYHGSVHVGNQIVYYAIGVFSEQLSNGAQNGIAFFDQSWKNIVATFYHELNEARTDADVEDANRTGDNSLLGWISDKGEEIGDIPILQAGGDLSLVFKEVPLTNSAETVPIQLQYSNFVGGPEGPIPAPHP